MAIKRMNIGTMIEDCVESVYCSFCWTEFKYKLQSRFILLYITESLRDNLYLIHQCNFDKVYSFLAKFLLIRKLIEFDQTTPRGSFVSLEYK
jgi:hypothetical protein